MQKNYSPFGLYFLNSHTSPTSRSKEKYGRIRSAVMHMSGFKGKIDSMNLYTEILTALYAG